MDRDAQKDCIDQQLVEMVRKRLAEGETVAVTVNGRSMLPLLRPNDTIQIASTQPEQLARGDIITIETGGELLTHRFWDYLEKSQQLKTRGDRQQNFDNPHNFRQLVGCVVRRERGDLQFQQGAGRWLNEYLKWILAISYKLEHLLKKDSDHSQTTIHRALFRLLRMGTIGAATAGVKVVESLPI